MSKFTLETLAKFIQDAADGGIMQRRRPAKELHMAAKIWNGIVWETVEYVPHLSCDIDEWQIVEPPKGLKIIDMSALIKSGIDCQFDNGRFISKLISCHGHHGETYYGSFISGAGTIIYRDCVPRMNHKHVLNDRECPLPEGFIVKVWYREGHAPITGHCVDMSWGIWHHLPGFVVFEVVGVVDGYVLPFEVKNANNT
jgi:hypothetical protein